MPACLIKAERVSLESSMPAWYAQIQKTTVARAPIIELSVFSCHNLLQ